MHKTLKLFLVLSLIALLSFGFYYVNATEDELEDSEIEEIDEVSDDNLVTTESTSDQSTLSVLSPNRGTSVTSINSYEQANLQLNNILSIILIAIGILLILFAIAILIRIGK